MLRSGILLAALAIASSGCSEEEPGRGTGGAGEAAPDGIPLPLPEGTTVAASLVMDISGDRKKDVLAAVRGGGFGVRVLRFIRRGAGYADGEPFQSRFLEGLPEDSIVEDGVRVTPVEPDFFRVEVRYEEECVEDEREQVAVEVFFPRRRGDEEIFRANASYRRSACPRATQEFLARCKTPEDVKADVRTLVHEGAREIEVNVEGVTFSVYRREGRLEGDAESATRSLRETLDETERLAPAGDVDGALARLEDMVRLVDLVCAGRGEPGCYGPTVGVPEEARPACDAEDLLLRTRTERARILAKAGRAREALRVLGPPAEPSGRADSAMLRTARADVLRITSPANAREIGKIPRARPPDPPGVHLRSPFAWPDDNHVVYVAGGKGRQTIFGLWRANVGDLGMLSPEKKYLAEPLRSEIRATDGTHVVAAADRFGVFVCGTGDDERSCRVFARESIGREAGARCSLVDEAVRGHGGVRIVIDPCSGPSDPVPLGFVEGHRLVLVARDSAKPLVVSPSSPTEREPLPPGPSPVFAGTSFLPDGSARLVASPEGVFLVSRGRPPREHRIRPPGEEVQYITVSPNGRRFVALEGERGARVWELP